MESGEFFKDDQELESVLMRLEPGSMIEFDGARIHVYGPFNPSPTLRETLQEQYPEHAISGYHDNNQSPYEAEEFLRLGSIDSIDGIPVLPMPLDEPNIVIPEVLLAEWGAIDDQEFYDPATDVSHLIAERKLQGEIFINDLRAYATEILMQRAELDRDAIIPCESCATVPNPRKYPCTHCSGSGYVPLNPPLILTNLDTNETSIIDVDPLKWLADGELAIRWASRDESSSIRTEGFIVDLKAYLETQLRAIGIDHGNSLEVHNTEYPVVLPQSLSISFAIDEHMFIPDALTFIMSRVSNYIRLYTANRQSLAMRARRTSSQLLRELQTAAQAFNKNLGYTQRLGGDEYWEPKHVFVLVSPDGREIVDILPDELLGDINELNLAMEQALAQLTDTHFQLKSPEN